MGFENPLAFQTYFSLSAFIKNGPQSLDFAKTTAFYMKQIVNIHS